MQRFTLLRVDVTHEDDDPALGAIKQKYGADTLPAIRLVSPDGAIVAKTDTFVPPEHSWRFWPARSDRVGEGGLCPPEPVAGGSEPFEGSEVKSRGRRRALPAGARRGRFGTL